jgi:uncharacterized coiled-coil protein SlyX
MDEYTDESVTDFDGNVNGEALEFKLKFLEEKMDFQWGIIMTLQEQLMETKTKLQSVAANLSELMGG